MANKKSWLEKAGLWETKEDGKSQDVATESSTKTNDDFNFDFSSVGATASETKPVQQEAQKVSSTTNARDPKIEERLKKVMTDANLPGPDYFEFKQQLDALNGVIPDEKTRYVAAFKTVQGIDKDKIAQSTKKYLEILSLENGKFSEAISQKSSKDIEFKTQEAGVLNSENVNMQKQIEELKAKIETNSQRIKTLASEVQKSKGEIAEAKRRFETTLNGFMGEIKKDAEKVTQYV